MKIRDWFKNKFSNRKVEAEPFAFGKFTINDTNLKLHEFDTNEKYVIDQKIKSDKSLLCDYETRSFLEAYEKDMNTFEGKVLRTKLDDFSIRAIMIENLSYDNGNIKDTFEFDMKRIGCKLRHPSIVLANSFVEARDIKSSLYLYLKCCVRNFVNFEKMTYKPDEYFSIKDGNDLGFSQENINNKEITFIKEENTERKDKISNSSRLYLLPNIFRKKSSPFKGVIIQNLSLINNTSSQLEDIDKKYETLCTNETENSEEFAKIAFELYEKTNGKISFISQMDDMIIIKGTDEEENIIYSTVDEIKLPDILKTIPKYTGENKSTVSNHNNVIDKVNKEDIEYI